VAGQGIERREMLRVLAMAAAAGQFPGFHRWAFACGHHGEGDVIPAPAARYTPQFFTADEYATLDQLTALILPSDGTPGARDAGVSEFIDFMVAHDPAIQYDFRFVHSANSSPPPRRRCCSRSLPGCRRARGSRTPASRKAAPSSPNCGATP
jgi:hypothetical protein